MPHGHQNEATTHPDDSETPEQIYKRYLHDTMGHESEDVTQVKICCVYDTRYVTFTMKDV